MGRENPRWGCMRIRGELLKLGVKVSATTIATALRRAGWAPLPDAVPRGGRSCAPRRPGMLACDFLTVETITLKTLDVLDGSSSGREGRTWEEPHPTPTRRGSPGRPKPGDGLPGRGMLPEVPDPRSGHQVQRVVRRGVPLTGHADCLDPHPGSERQRLLANDGWAPSGPSAWTGRSSSAADTLNGSFGPTSRITTNRGHIAVLIFGRQRGTHRQQSAT
jgi:hypothetical protein